MEKDLREMMNCALCLEEANDPRILKCQHTYCVSCLVKYIASCPHPHTTLPCPLCRAVCDIPNGDAQKLPKNIFYKTIYNIVMRGNVAALDLAEVAAAAKQSVKFRSVERCSAVDCQQMAAKYCESGCEYICKDHLKEHAAGPFTKKHKVVMAKDHTTSRADFPQCESHLDQVLNVFCKTCEIPICVTCLDAKHRKHDWCGLNDVVDKYRDQLQHTMTRVATLIKCVKKAMNTTDQQAEKMERDITGLHEEVTATFLISKLKKEEPSMHEQLRRAEEAAVKTHEEVKYGQEAMLAKLESVEFYGMSLLGADKEYHYATNCKKLTTSLDEHQKTELPEFAFTSDFSKDTVQIGKSKVDMSHSLNHPHSADSHKPGGGGGGGRAGRSDRPDKLRMQHQGKVITGLAVCGEVIFVVHADTDQLYIYNGQGLVTTARVPGLVNAFDMALMNSDTLVISDWEGKMLHWLAVRVHSVQCTVGSTRKQKLSYKPRGVCATSQQVTVCGDGGRLHLYDGGGRDVTTITLPGDVRPWSVTADRQGGHIICGGGSLWWVSSRGQVTRSISSSDPGCKFETACHVTTDQQGRVLLTDYHGHGVLLLTSDGQYIRHLVKDGITLPTRTALDEQQDKLWISHGKQGSPEVMCVDYQPDPGATAAPPTPTTTTSHDSDTAGFRRVIHTVSVRLYLPQL